MLCPNGFLLLGIPKMEKAVGKESEDGLLFIDSGTIMFREKR